MASLAKVIIGILIIGAMYIIPFFHVFGSSYTLSTIASLCDNPIIAILGGSACQTYKMYFYIGWIAGIIFISWGMLSKDSN
jgi:hypothetical protein